MSLKLEFCGFDTVPDLLVPWKGGLDFALGPFLLFGHFAFACRHDDI